MIWTSSQPESRHDPLALFSVSFRCLHAGLHAHQIFDLALQQVIEPDQQQDGALVLDDRLAEFVQPRRQARPEWRGFQEWNQFLGQRRRIGERESLGVRLDEEVEGVDDREVRDQVDFDLDCVGALRKDQPRDPVPIRILLPVEEVRLGLYIQRVAQDRRPAMRRRPQPDFVRRDGDVAVETIGRAVGQRYADCHVGACQIWFRVCDGMRFGRSSRRELESISSIW
jgi:hypothetical protein